MCAGAAVIARVAEIIYGTPDPKGGAVSTLYRIASDPRLNHRGRHHFRRPRGGVRPLFSDPSSAPDARAAR